MFRTQDRLEAAPLRLHHGTAGAFETFSDDFLGHASGHPSAAIGHFFSSCPRVARSFCLDPDVVDKAYDTNRGSTIMLDDIWIARQSTPWIDQASVVEVDVIVKRFAIIPAREFAAMVDEEADWASFRAALLEKGVDALRIVSDPSAVDRQDLCLEYSADMWVILDPAVISIAARNSPDFCSAAQVPSPLR